MKDMRGSVGANVKPKIFLYDLPELKELKDWNKYGDVTDTRYGLDQLLPALLHDSPYITKNAEEADYFMPDVWLQWPHSATNLDRVVEAVRMAGPWWDKTGGADHIFVVSADQGRCSYPKGGPAQKSIFLLHYGGGTNLKNEECDFDAGWTSKCDRELMFSDLVAEGKEGDVQLCFLYGQDIVVPFSGHERHVSVDDHQALLSGQVWDFIPPKNPYLHPEQAALTHNRTTALFFSGQLDSPAPPGGKPWQGMQYSHGVLQTVHKMWGHLNHYQITEGGMPDTQYFDRLAGSVFCLATEGWGWTPYLKAAITRGCIPVVVQDGAEIDFESQLPWFHMGLRLPMWMVPKLAPILEYVEKKGRVPMMQTILGCTWRLFWWRRPHGRAFEVLMCELKRRKLGAERMQVNLEECRMECGDGKWVDVKSGWNNV